MTVEEIESFARECGSGISISGAVSFPIDYVSSAGTDTRDIGDWIRIGSRALKNVNAVFDDEVRDVEPSEGEQIELRRDRFLEFIADAILMSAGGYPGQGYL